MLFRDRQDAGRQLSQQLKMYRDTPVVVCALPRGGVPVAAEISTFLHAPMELIFAHKIGHPYQPECSIAAVSESGHVVGPPPQLQLSLGNGWLEQEKAFQINEMKRKRERYLEGQNPVSIENKVAILVDDGVANGLTMQAGILELKEHQPKKIVVAVPIAPESVAKLIKSMVDDFVGTVIDDDKFLGAVGAYYAEFKQLEDEDVMKMMSTQPTKN